MTHQILIDAENGLCPICKKDINECAVVEYHEFYGHQVGVCGAHPTPVKRIKPKEGRK